MYKITWTGGTNANTQTTDDALTAYDWARRYCEARFTMFVPEGVVLGDQGYASVRGEARFTNPDVTASLDVLWQQLDNGELTEWHCGPISVIDLTVRTGVGEQVD